MTVEQTPPNSATVTTTTTVTNAAGTTASSSTTAMPMGQAEYAGFILRFAAYIVDIIILFIPDVVLSIFFTLALVEKWVDSSRRF